MSGLYSTLRNAIRTPIVCAGLAAIVLTGTTHAETQQNEKLYFDDWKGYELYLGHFSNETVSMEVADFDGDGDKDIAVVAGIHLFPNSSEKRVLRMKIYENRIPQKESK